ncbi:Misato segment II tubulin-like domain-containing protein [Suillus bovinus]|uniref:Misato segment II tubulin-like domain-containing protein n=1 Tax=Suillus bovinus TaxID=48563 RepID=UPI001B872D6A|nr:Misato segment II tubulin-like domain-containing protein [Suillus bovinus]KAG2139792.1 Misato segment II tubulin-like domain-containing protein [Suillus bovinus]
MREIIYIQAGPFANYAGTHFWNTQESYFTYDDDDEPIVNHDLSFEEGRNPQNQPTLCPRLLTFDQKSNFGTLAKTSQADAAIDASLDTTWRGRVVRETQDPIPQSEYHARLEGETDEGDPERTDSNIRYWSDYSRAVPDALESTEAGWSVGQDLFRRYNEDTELMEGAFRLLVENCDNFQVDSFHAISGYSLRLANDAGYALLRGFSHAFLTAFRDEPNHAGIDNFLDTKRIINDALCLQSLHQLSDIAFPILNPSRWSALESNLSQGLAYDQKNSLYHTGVISLKGSREDIATMADHLNWRKCSRLGQLGGVVSLPCSVTEATFTDLYCNFSTGLSNKGEHAIFARRNVTRGLQDQDLAAFDAWCDLSSLREPLISSIHAPSYPVPTSFPSIFRHTKPTSMRMVSSLVTAPSTSIPLMGYARFVEQTARTRRSDGALMSMDLESDDVKELASALMDEAND